MAVPNTRATLISYCKRRLGDGLIDINITTDQESDVMDDALSYYQDYHYDAIHRTFLKHQVTLTNQVTARGSTFEIFRIVILVGVVRPCSRFMREVFDTPLINASLTRLILCDVRAFRTRCPTVSSSVLPFMERPQE